MPKACHTLIGLLTNLNGTKIIIINVKKKRKNEEKLMEHSPSYTNTIESYYCVFLILFIVVVYLKCMKTAY